jgi:hypothetical protein
VGFVAVGRSVADDSERTGRVSSSNGWFSSLALAGRWLEVPATGAAAVVSRQAHRSQDEGEDGGEMSSAGPDCTPEVPHATKEAHVRPQLRP